MKDLTVRMTDALCYGGLDIVRRQLEECDLILAADTCEKLAVARFRLECWRRAIRVRSN